MINQNYKTSRFIKRAQEVFQVCVLIFDFKKQEVFFEGEYSHPIFKILESDVISFKSWISKISLGDDPSRLFQFLTQRSFQKSFDNEFFIKILSVDEKVNYFQVKVLEVDESQGLGGEVFVCGFMDGSAFKHKEELFEGIQKMASIGGWELDPASGTTTWTKQVYAIYGIDPTIPTDKIMGVNYYAEHERDRIKKYVEACIDGVSYRGIFDFVDARGREKKVEAMGHPIFDLDGKVIKVRGTFQDVTERENLILELKRILDENHWYKMWVQNAREGICQLDFHGNFQFVNPVMEKMFGFKKEALLSKNIFDFVDNEWREIGKQKFLRSSDSDSDSLNHGETSEFLFRSAQGKPVWVNLSVVRIKHENIFQSHTQIAILSDIQEIKNKEQQIEALVNSLDDIVFEIDHDHYFHRVWVSDESKLFMPKSFFIGKKYEDVLPPFIANPLRQALSSLGSLLSSTSFDYEAPSGVGDSLSNRIFRAKATRQTDFGGGMFNYTVTICDVTKQKTLEAQKEMAIRELDKFFNISIELLCIASNDGYFKKLNKQWEKVLGFTQEELKSKPFLDWVHPDDVAATLKEMELLAKGHTTIRFENRFRTKIGGYRNLSWSSSPDPESNLLYAAARDITDEKEASRLLVEAQSIAKIGSWSFDITSGVVSWSSELYRIFEIDSMVRGRELYNLYRSRIHQEDLLKLDQAVSDAISSKKGYSIDHRICLQNGTVHWIRGISEVVLDSENSERVVTIRGTAQDITHVVEAEEKLKFEKAKAMQNAKLASMGEMSAGVAHEINNPLAIISGVCKSLWKHRTDEGEYVKKMEQVDKAVERISKIVTGLRKFSRSSQNREMKEHSLNKIIQEALAMTESKAQRDEVKVNFVSDYVCWIMCDEIEIEQVFINLINNAIDAVKSENEKWVEVSMVKTTNDNVFVQVKDSGRGVAVENREKLFQPFFTTKPVGQGTGLGLSIAKGILEEHSASIQLMETCEHTCFEIIFPVVQKS